MIYDLPLEERKVKPHHVTTLHLVCALAFITTGGIIFRYNYIITMWGAALMGIGVVLLILTMFRNKWLTSRNINTAIRIIELAVALTVAIYSLIQYWKFPAMIFGVLSASLIFGLYWERASGNALSVIVDENGVRVPVSGRQRFLKWTEIEQIVLRFGALTINCVDNRLFQWSLGNGNIDPDTFETYCNTQIEVNRSKRSSDDW